MQKITITTNDKGKRIDKFLISYYNLPKSLVMKNFRKKDIRVNGIKIKDPSYLLKDRDLITTYFKEVDSKVEIPNVDFSDLIIVYQDENIMIVDKPSEIMVSGDKNNDLVSKVQSYLDAKGKIPKNTSFLPGNVHRIDKNTTGLVIFAMNYPTHRTLTEALTQEGVISKKYVAKVVGKFTKKQTLIHNLQHNEKQQKMVIASNGKKSITKVYPLLHEAKFSFVEAEILSGRKHQIRVQLAHIGYPLFGDPKYGGPKAKTLHLCAYELIFNNLTGDLSYLNGKEFKATLPEYLNIGG